jgi:hypothetical protein
MNIKKYLLCLLLIMAVNNTAFSAVRYAVTVINTEEKNTVCGYDLENRDEKKATSRLNSAEDDDDDKGEEIPEEYYDEGDDSDEE